MPADVLLLNPNRMKPPVAPLALEYLGDALARAGLPFAVCDLCFAEDPVATLAAGLDRHVPRLIAVTMRNSDDCYCATQHSFIPDLRHLVSACRGHSDAPIVLGGAGYSTAPHAILQETGADFGVVGDGEGPLVALARTLRDGGEVADVPGLVYRTEDGIQRNPPVWAEFGQKPLSRTHTDTARYFREGGQAGIETKRGCPQGCTYCADFHSKGHHTRLRPPEVVAAEVGNLLAQGADALHTCDAEFNVPPEHAKAVCRALIEAGLGDRVRWWAYCAPGFFDAELAGLMREAGCQGINFGADSGDAEMLRRLGRAHTPDDIRDARRLCRDHGMACMFDLLLGGPGETRDSLRRSIELMKESEPTCVGAALGMRLYAGTAVAESVRREGFTTGNPSLRGRVEGNAEMAWPVFYLEAGLGEDVVSFLRELIAGDQRFFFGHQDEAQADYNYDDNQALVDAIAAGARGAYWDILRQTLGLPL